jgi:hypothetical protein
MPQAFFLIRNGIEKYLVVIKNSGGSPSGVSKWRLLKFGKDTPYIGMFCHWTKLDNNSFSGYKEVLDTEEYEETGVDTKFKVFTQFFKNLIK